MLAPPDQLNLISGAAFQMMHELMWFEEVKKVMQPSYIENKNSSGRTPSELFSLQHQKLLKQAKSWMERTASSCMFISTVIATGVLSAAFSIPRYAENDFLSSLPLKLIFGLQALFISITSMMVAFSSALFIIYYHDLKLVPGLMSALAFLLMPLFLFLQYPLWSDIIYSVYYRRSLFQPRNYKALLY
ncbi:hypothetical protein L6164_017139 [Bauhinia variegata]|uniref:Uncharacterized protein n=1 Tax=Bauhinia variegata TaxID=167791 RepID=A0ACB9N7J8_BAUVA|nr:hypothetical protein L6164_017139 [Bauhinia variegata]